MRSRDPRCTSRLLSTAFCLLVACTFTSIGVPVNAQTDAGDSSILTAEEILLKVFDATGGLRWTERSNWLQSPDVCSFFGVTCYEEDFADQARRGHIQELDLSDNHLVGTIPDEVFHLAFIESIVLRDNGDLFMNFNDIGQAQYLTSLIISDTHIQNIDGIEQATSLETLHITSLGIGTSIPLGIFQLVNLKGLFANFNAFTGKLPTEVGNLKAMTELYFFENDLTGQIPTEIGLLTGLTTLSLGSNAFSGNLPTELNLCTQLKKLAVERAPGGEKGPGVTGSLPSLNALTDITEVSLDHQKFNGPIPDDFLASAPLQQVITVDLTNNQISGSVPDSLTKFERMTLNLADNEIDSRTDSFCSMISGWMGGDVGDSTLGCDSFLCPKGTAAPDGRKTATQSCETCADALYFGVSSCSTTAEGDINERAILVSFYNKAGGRYWKQSDNWLNPAESVCNWFGIDCTEDGKVTNINMKNNDLTDTPPPELFTLPELKILNLSSNSLKFKFEGIDKATKLEILDLTQCDMESLDGIENIKSTVFRKLSVASNYLQGAVPAGLFSLISLQELDISHNRFSGVLPSQIGNLINLVRLQCFGNNFNGQIPSEIGNLVRLIELMAAENDFTGVLPDTLNSLSNLETLSLRQTTSSSGIGGPLLPLTNLMQLASLQLDDNDLTGELPDNLLESTLRGGNDRIELLLSNNFFEGTVPSSWASRFGRLAVDLSGNEITGIGNGLCDQDDWMDGTVGRFSCDAILCPKQTYNEFGKRSSVAGDCRPCSQSNFFGARECEGDSSDVDGEIDILGDLFASTHGNNWNNSAGWQSTEDYCGWFGVGCNGNGEVVKISLGENGLTGTPSSSIFKLPSLRELNLEHNEINFSFDGISQATSLTVLRLSGINLNSVVGIGEASSLVELHLTDNDLAGSIPDEFFELTDLRQLFLNYNNLEGRISASISALRNLEELFLFHNRLGGQLPAALGSFSNLRTLSLSENNFDGTLPPELNDLSQLEVLAIQREGGTDSTTTGNVGINQEGSDDEGPGLTGPLLAFEKLTQLKQLFLGSNSLSGSIPSNFLDGIDDKSVMIEVDLVSNSLSGPLPASLVRFDRLTLYVADNQITEIPDGICRNDGWMMEKVKSAGCNAILCPPGFVSVYGREADDNSKCSQCPSAESAPFYGSFVCQTQNDKDADYERAILEEFYLATDGDNWKHNEGWMDPDLSVCDWHGVICSSSEIKSVESIHLMQNGLLGDISGSIYELQSLEEINLAFNDVTLSFSGINNAKNLEYINLDSTFLKSLSGVEQASNLKLLHVVDNDFGDTFPNEITLVPSLEVLFLSDNSIGTMLPSDFDNLSNLRFFACERCGLEGNLPALLGSLTKMEYLYLPQNSFEGGLIDDLQQLTSLKYLDLSKQGGGGLNGTIPSFSNFTQLSELYLSVNGFEGSLPDAFLENADTSVSVTVDLRSNRLTGAIPVGLARFDKMTIDLGDNLIDTPPADELCAKSWNDKSAATSDCDFILCNVGSANGFGRATRGLPCRLCSREGEASTYGSTECGTDDEREALVSMYRELNGVGWVNSYGWTSQDHHCTWYGITCYDSTIRNQLVQTIDLSANNLDGILPDSIWNLVHMTELNLRENAVDVSFADIGNAQSLKSLTLSQTKVQNIDGIKAATALESLHLTSNDIAGPLPDDIFQLTKLERLFLNFNSFTGPLPTLIGQLTALSELYMFNNALTGIIPTELGRPIGIKVISLGENNFIGEIPNALSFLPFLEVLSLEKEERSLMDEVAGKARNPGLSGTLPQFHRVSKLRELYLGSNSIGGTIPGTFLAGVASKASTLRVDLTSNSIHGTIPEALTAFDDLRLFVADNLIHGIPNEICSKEAWMDGLLASGCDALLCPPGMFNKYGRRINSEPCQTCDHRGSSKWYGSTFCGALLPETLTEKEILEELFSAAGGLNWKDKTNWLASNSVCSWKGISCELDTTGDLTVTEIDLSSNSLNGYVPSIVFYLPSLRSLNVGDNDVTVSFRDIQDAASLEELYFDSTRVVSIEGIGAATNLKTLKMDNNAFFGRSLPDEIFALSNLITLDISRNGFIGTLSSLIERLTKLETLRGAYNDLSGEIPSSIGNLGMLQEISLEENNFFGVLPAGLEDLLSLKSISLQAHTRTSAGLSGPPLSFAKSPLLRNIDLGSNSLTGTIPDDLLLAAASSPNDRITVQLDSNFLTGFVPTDLALRFSRLDIDLTGNRIEGIPEGLCDQIPQWMNGDVGRYSCRGLLCPAGEFNAFGRQTSEETRCEACPDTEDSYLGSTICPSIRKAQARQILESLFRDTGGSNWKRKDGWLDQNEDICDWYGITCRDSVEVESIILGSNNLVGTPPKELFELFGLKMLWLYSNPIDFRFTGGEMATTLKSLQLDATGLKSLNGIGNFPSLTDVDVRFNQLSGPLSNEIASLSNLETFFCGDNALSGPLPSFDTNRKLTTLRVGGNAFSGPLPSFDVHPNLKTLDVSINQLTGEIPNTFFSAADPSKPVFIDISSNLISGTIPGTLSRLSEVTLYARDNKIQGIHPDLCSQDLWNGGDVGLFGCDAILCPPSSYSPIGRTSDNGSTCLPCKQTIYFGRSECSKLRGPSASSGWSSYLLARYAVGFAALGLWAVL